MKKLNEYTVHRDCLNFSSVFSIESDVFQGSLLFYDIIDGFAEKNIKESAQFINNDTIYNIFYSFLIKCYIQYIGTYKNAFMMIHA